MRAGRCSRTKELIRQMAAGGIGGKPPRNLDDAGGKPREPVSDVVTLHWHVIPNRHGQTTPSYRKSVEAQARRQPFQFMESDCQYSMIRIPEFNLRERTRRPGRSARERPHRRGTAKAALRRSTRSHS